MAAAAKPIINLEYLFIVLVDFNVYCFSLRAWRIIIFIAAAIELLPEPAVFFVAHIADFIQVVPRAVAPVPAPEEKEPEQGADDKEEYYCPDEKEWHYKKGCAQQNANNDGLKNPVSHFCLSIVTKGKTGEDGYYFKLFLIFLRFLPPQE